jgi:hypothetical protein
LSNRFTRGVIALPRTVTMLGSAAGRSLCRRRCDMDCAAVFPLYLQRVSPSATSYRIVEGGGRAQEGSDEHLS